MLESCIVPGAVTMAADRPFLDPLVSVIKTLERVFGLHRWQFSVVRYDRDRLLIAGEAIFTPLGLSLIAEGSLYSLRALSIR